MNKKVLLLLLLTLLIMLSYEVISIGIDERQMKESSKGNETNSSINQSIVVPLERPPFLEEEKT